MCDWIKSDAAVRYLEVGKNKKLVEASGLVCVRDTKKNKKKTWNLISLSLSHFKDMIVENIQLAHK